MKFFDLLEKENIIPEFTCKIFFVKSYSRPNDIPHVMKDDENGIITCDNHWPRYNGHGFCHHATAVS